MSRKDVRPGRSLTTDTPDLRKAWQPTEHSPLDPSPSVYLSSRTPKFNGVQSSERSGFLNGPSIFRHRAAASAPVTPLELSSPSFEPPRSSSLKRIERRRAHGRPTPQTGFFVPSPSPTVSMSEITAEIPNVGNLERCRRKRFVSSMITKAPTTDTWTEEGIKDDAISLGSGRRGAKSFASKTREKLAAPFKSKSKHGRLASEYDSSLFQNNDPTFTAESPLASSKTLDAESIILFNQSTEDVLSGNSILSTTTIGDPEDLEYLAPKNLDESPNSILERIRDREALADGLPDEIHTHERKIISEEPTEDYCGVHTPVTSKAESSSVQGSASDSREMLFSNSAGDIAAKRDHAVGETTSSEFPFRRPHIPAKSSQKLDIIQPRVILSQAPTEASPLRPCNGLVLSEALAILYACTTYAALRVSLQNAVRPLPGNELMLQMTVAWFVGIMICLAGHWFFRGRPKRIRRIYGIYQDGW